MEIDVIPSVVRVWSACHVCHDAQDEYICIFGESAEAQCIGSPKIVPQARVQVLLGKWSFPRHVRQALIVITSRRVLGEEEFKRRLVVMDLAGQRWHGRSLDGQ